MRKIPLSNWRRNRKPEGDNAFRLGLGITLGFAVTAQILVPVPDDIPFSRGEFGIPFVNGLILGAVLALLPCLLVSDIRETKRYMFTIGFVSSAVFAVFLHWFMGGFR